MWYKSSCLIEFLIVLCWSPAPPDRGVNPLLRGAKGVDVWFLMFVIVLSIEMAAKLWGSVIYLFSLLIGLLYLNCLDWLEKSNPWVDAATESGFKFDIKIFLPLWFKCRFIYGLY